MTKPNAIPEEIKIFIVQQFAMFSKPAQIGKEVKDLFEVDMTRESIRNFDCSTPRGQRRCGKKLLAIFDETRERFIEGVTHHPIAHKAYRIQKLGEMAEEAAEKKNYKLAADLIEQAAKETGGFYTNEIKLKGRVSHDHTATVTHVSMEEKRNMLSDRLRDAVSRMEESKSSATVQ